MNIFLESVGIIFASYIIFGGKKSAITLIVLIGLFITTYLKNKHLFALEFSRISRICSSMRRAISNMKLSLGSRKLAVEIDKETEEQQQERLEKAERKITDFFTNKLEGETKKSDDKEKEIYLVEYSYRWYLGLRAKNIFEEEMDVLQDFLNHIWNCYGIFSAKKLRSMLCIEIEIMDIRYNTLPRPYFSLDTIEIRIDNIKHYNFTQDVTQDFYSYHNKEIEKYLPPNAVITISDDGLYEIVRVGAFDGK